MRMIRGGILLSEFEKLLTVESRTDVEKYFLFLNPTSPEPITYLEKVKQTLGKPLSNAFYLHEIKEMNSLRDMGLDPFKHHHNYRDSRPMRAHTRAVEFQHSYLQELARSMDYSISIQTLIRFNPLLAGDRNMIFQYLYHYESINPDAVVFYTDMKALEEYLKKTNFSEDIDDNQWHETPNGLSIQIRLRPEYKQARIFFRKLLKEEPQWILKK